MNFAGHARPLFWKSALNGSSSAESASGEIDAPDAPADEHDLRDRRKDTAILIGSMPARPGDVGRAAVVAGLLIVPLLFIAPYASRQLPAIPAIIPLNNIAIVIFDLITAILLYAQYRELRERSFLALACGYLFIPLVVAAHAASYPEAFRPGRLIGGPQTGAWLWMAWHALSPLFVVSYALLARGERAGRARYQRRSWVLAGLATLGTLVLATTLVLVATDAEHLLPRLLKGGSRYTSVPLVLSVICLEHVAALLLIWTMRSRRLLDGWIAVTVLATLIEFALTGIFSDGRYQVGFYAGRLYGLFASALVLSVLLREAVGLHGRVLQTALALAESEERQSFLLRLGDALRPVSDAMMVQQITARMLVDHLGADGASYTEFFVKADDTYLDAHWIYYPRNSAPIKHWQSLDQLGSFDAELLAGRRVIVENTLTAGALTDTERVTASELRVLSIVSVPLFKQGRVFAALSVCQSKPRRWSSSELALIDEVAERTWGAVERAKAEAALRESDELRRIAVESGGMGVWQWRLDDGVVRGDRNAMRLVGLPDTDGWISEDRYFLDRMTPESLAAVQELIKQPPEAKEDLRGEVAIRFGEEIRWLAWRGRTSSADARMILGVSFDITEQKRAEQALREREELQAFLLKLGDLLRPLQSPLDVQLAVSRLLGERLQVAQVAVGEVNSAGDQITIGRGWCRDSSCSITGNWKLDDFGESFENSTKAGKTVVVTDVAREPEMRPLRNSEADDGSELRSYICVPLVKQARLMALMFVCHTEPRKWTASERHLVEVTCARFWAELERARAQESLRASEQRLSMALEAARMGTYEWSAAARVAVISQPSVELFGLVEQRLELDEAYYSALTHPDDLERHRAVIQKVIETGQNMYDEFRIIRPRDGEVVWIEERGRTFIDPVTGELRIRGMHIDITEKKKKDEAIRHSQERQQLLLAELQHRVRNIMAMIRSVARRTSRSSGSVDEYVALFEGRINAMSRTQTLLTRQMGRGVDLKDLVVYELEAQAAQQSQFSCAGPTVSLSAKAAELLSLAMHELATNAVKYGALSNVQGHIHVRWYEQERQGRRWLALRWSEAGVAIHERPVREGFGTELITRRVPYELEGKGTITVGKNGLVATIEFPLLPGESTLQTDINDVVNRHGH